MNDRAARRSLILAGQTLVARTPQKLYLSKQVMNVPAFAGDCANCTRASKRVQSPVWFRLRRVRTIRFDSHPGRVTLTAKPACTIALVVLKGPQLRSPLDQRIHKALHPAKTSADLALSSAQKRLLVIGSCCYIGYLPASGTVSVALVGVPVHYFFLARLARLSALYYAVTIVAFALLRTRHRINATLRRC